MLKLHLSAYPELSCFGLPVEVPEYGFTPNIFCAGKEEVFAFFEKCCWTKYVLFSLPLISIWEVTKHRKITGTSVRIVNRGLLQ